MNAKLRTNQHLASYEGTTQLCTKGLPSFVRRDPGTKCQIDPEQMPKKAFFDRNDKVSLQKKKLVIENFFGFLTTKLGCSGTSSGASANIFDDAIIDCGN
ncbi:hypothetical protein HanRHA438_Chr06g0278731 [Helianthus annuus]|nr:hypothetical protein HanRHA438_Chr06g0278731 [Helianthus annuus]